MTFCFRFRLGSHSGGRLVLPLPPLEPLQVLRVPPLPPPVAQAERPRSPVTAEHDFNPQPDVIQQEREHPPFTSVRNEFKQKGYYTTVAKLFPSRPGLLERAEGFPLSTARMLIGDIRPDFVARPARPEALLRH